MSAPAPPTTPPPPTGSKEKRALAVTVLGIVLILLYVVLYLLPTHHPRPNGLEVGVVGPAPQVQQLRSTLGAQDPGLDFRRYASVDAATTAIRERRIYGAFDLQGSRAVLTAPAASYQVAQLLQQAGMAQQITRVQVVVPLPEGDSQGTALSNLVLPVLITAMLLRPPGQPAHPGARDVGPDRLHRAHRAVRGLRRDRLRQGDRRPQREHLRPVGLAHPRDHGDDAELHGVPAPHRAARPLRGVLPLPPAGQPGVRADLRARAAARAVVDLRRLPATRRPRLGPAPHGVLRRPPDGRAALRAAGLAAGRGAAEQNLWADRRTRDRSPAEATAAPTGQGAQPA